MGSAIDVEPGKMRKWASGVSETRPEAERKSFDYYECNRVVQ